MSVPLCTPQSSIISTSGPTAARISGRTSMVAGLVSSCRPPWLETQMVVNPHSRARTASSGLQIPCRQFYDNKNEELNIFIYFP